MANEPLDLDSLAREHDGHICQVGWLVAEVRRLQARVAKLEWVAAAAREYHRFGDNGDEARLGAALAALEEER